MMQKQLHLMGIDNRIGYLADTLCVRIRDSLRALSFYPLNKQ